jgi:predicted DCC family thiol-disulfide oxidoreductase YuxK
MKLLTADGRLFGGADAIVQITRSIWWAWPFYAIAQLPGIKKSLRTIYIRIARNRHCFSGRCRLPAQRTQTHRHLTSCFYEMP